MTITVRKARKDVERRSLSGSKTEIRRKLRLTISYKQPDENKQVVSHDKLQEKWVTRERGVRQEKEN